MAESNTASSSFKFVDLLLPKDKLPLNDPVLTAGSPKPFYEHAYRFVEPSLAGGRIGVLGTREESYVGAHDTGLFGTIFKVWANHWNLRTIPDDWWLPLISRVAKTVDEKADTPELRKLFVKGRAGKEEIRVECPSFSIYDTDYNYLFSSFSEEIDKRVSLPSYVPTVVADFSTTTSNERIASQITLMTSVQKYFDYTMMICGCGILGLEMGGTEEDWANLRRKLDKLEELLAPVESILNLKNVFSQARTVFNNLLVTYTESTPEAMRTWWSEILIQGTDIEYGPSGMRRDTVTAYNGWIVSFLTSFRSLKAKKLSSGDYAKDLSCLCSCPMKIVDMIRKVEDMSRLVAGVLGYNKSTCEANGVTSLKAVHGWSLMLPPDSPLVSKA